MGHPFCFLNFGYTPDMSPGFILLVIIQFLSILPVSAAAPTLPQKDGGTAAPVPTTGSGRVELCLSCHQQRLGSAHSRQALGCTPCHLGNPLTLDKERAHRGMVLNPGELRWVEKTCGRSGCHAKQTKWVKSSLMATNLGITTTLTSYWGEEHRPLTVEELKKGTESSPAMSYFRKLCGSCHLWFPRHRFPGFLAQKGGGCTACHLKALEVKPDPTGRVHPQIRRWPPMENCVRCHNRSGRIGLSYQGLYENEGYGTPLEEGDFAGDQLEDGRFVSHLSPDIHYEKGLICSDCHTQHETMGDGKVRTHWEQQVEVRCTTCHGSRELQAAIVEENGGKPPRSWPGRRTPALFIQRDGSGFCLELKERERCLPLTAPRKETCLDGNHRRLSCQACHSPWVPQCYGCHVRYDPKERQLDKITGVETLGRWEEFRSFMRYEAPPLGVMERGGHGEVVILVPG